MADSSKVSIEQILDLIIDEYEDKPDDFTLSIGHWDESVEGLEPEFVALLKLELGQIRRMRDELRYESNGSRS